MHVHRLLDLRERTLPGTETVGVLVNNFYAQRLLGATGDAMVL